ncbi:MAG TPA: type II toxin-antitoxin system VapC family toxin [Allosphingosinicella sp.]
MIAVDTNVVVRLLVGDDPAQTLAAQRCVAAGAVVSHGVLMEAEWVLRTVYRLAAQRIADDFGKLLDLDCIHMEDRKLLRWAVERYRGGADWAHLLHLIAARGHAGFATFDCALPRQAGKDAPVAIEVLR